MKTRLLLLSLSLAVTSAFAQQTLGSGIDKANMDLSVKPGNDFYRYAAGGWMKSHPLDAEHPMNGAFVDLEEQNQKRIQGLINEFASKPQQKGSLGQKIGSIYNLMMDSVRLNREGAAPLKPYLDKVAAIKNIHEFQYNVLKNKGNTELTFFTTFELIDTTIDSVIGKYLALFNPVTSTSTGIY